MGAFRSNFDRRLVDRHTRPHGGAQGDLLHVYTLGGSRLGLSQVCQHRFQVAPDGIRLKTDLADAAMDDAVLVGAVTYLPRLGILDRGLHVGCRQSPSCRP